MTACQLARILEKNVSSISHHLSALEKAGLVEQTRTSMRGNLVEKYYRATAKKFIISYTLSEGLIPGSEDIAKWNREVCKSAADHISAFGYDVPKERVRNLQRLIERYASLESMTFERIISRQKGSDRINTPVMRLLLSLLTNVHLFQNAEYVKIIGEICKELNITKGETVKK